MITVQGRKDLTHVQVAVAIQVFVGLAGRPVDHRRADTTATPLGTVVVGQRHAAGQGFDAIPTKGIEQFGTEVAYGVNWVFGDTLSNYVSGNEGYVVSDFAVAPEPASLALLSLGGLAMLRRR